jgi:hypothetical protein
MVVVVDRLKDRRSYKYNALKEIIRHGEPTLNDIHKQLCVRGNCPAGVCQLSATDDQTSCGHVIAVHILSAKVNGLFNY